MILVVVWESSDLRGTGAKRDTALQAVMSETARSVLPLLKKVTSRGENVRTEGGGTLNE